MIDLAFQERLGKRRAVVGHFHLVADERDASLKTFLAQARRRLHAAVARADDHDRCRNAHRLVSSSSVT